MRITTLLPATGFERPSADQLRELLRIVRAEYEWIPTIEDAEFSRAFFAVGLQYKLSEPDKVHHFSWHVDNCCNFLSQIGRADVDGNAVFASVVAHSDFDFRLANPAKGQLLTLAMDPYTGAKCTNSWKAVLAGRPLREPLPPKPIPRRPVESMSRPRFYEEGVDGKVREFNPAPWMR